MSSVNLIKCGVRFESPAIVITYEDVASSKIRRRTMPLRSFSKYSDVVTATESLSANSKHRKYLEKLPRRQLEKLITIIHDRLNGISLNTSLEKNKKIDTLDPDEDLNKVDDDVLRRKKALMEETFEKNQKKPGDDGFVYDVDVDFDTGIVETCDWDDSDSDPEF